MDPGNDCLIGIELLVNPDQPRELPPDVAKSFVLKDVFRTKYEEVEWIHALTALDYLRGYEATRRSKLRGKAEILGITKDNWRDIFANDPGAKTWVEEVEEQELRVESLYAKIFVDLRIWVFPSNPSADDC